MRHSSPRLTGRRGEPEVERPLSVSVLLPYRDAAATLGEALDSVLTDTEVPLEVIAVDDGSTDRGPQLVGARRDARLRCLSTGGRGLVAALELGRAAARGDFIGRMDADDVCLPGRWRAQVAALEASPALGAVGARVEVLCAGPVGEGLARYVHWQNGLLSPAEHRRDLLVESPLCHPSVLMRREALDSVGGYRDASWAEDWDLWLRLDAAGWALAKLPEVFLQWRHHPDRATFNDPRYSHEALRRARAAFLAPRVRGRPFAIWGAGRTGTRLARALEPHGVYPSRFIDIDPAKIGRVRRTRPVVSPAELVPDELVVVAVGARGAREEVRARLSSRDLQEGQDFICAA